MMKKLFKRVAVLFMIAVKIIALLFIGLLLFKHLNKVMKNKEVDYGNSFRAMPKNSVDVLFLGSSHAQFSTIPSFIYRKLGLVSYNMSSQCQPIPVSLEFLKEALKTQKPKLVVQEIFIALPGRETCRAESNYIVGQYQLTGNEKQTVLDMIRPEKALEYRQDFLKNHNNWKNVKHINELIQVPELHADMVSDSFGYVYADTMYYENYWPAEVYENTQDYVLDELDIQALEEMKKLCDENGIELMLYHVPMAMSKEDQAAKYQLWNWAENKGIKYLDFFTPEDLEQFFIMVHSDTHHNNILGANYVTTKIADFIAKEYSISVSQNVDEHIEQKYLQHSDALVKDIIFKEFNPNFIVNSAQDFKGLIAVRYLHDKNELSDQDLALLKKIGIAINREQDYFALIQNKQVIADSFTSLNHEYNNKHFQIDRTGILVNGEEKNISIEYFKGEEVKLSADFTIIFYGEQSDWEVIKNFSTETHYGFWAKGFAGYVPIGYW